MVDFLSAGQRDAVLKLFGPNTEAGRQLRQIFGTTQQQNSRKVNYPVFNTQKRELLCDDSNNKPLKVKPRVKYLKRNKTDSPKPVFRKPGRRPASVINEQMDMWYMEPQIDRRKDLSQEKEILQERFQFYDSKVSEPSREDIFATRKRIDEPKQISQSVIQDIMEAQTDLETCSNEYVKIELQNRIQRGIKELKLLANFT
jgi:hypothetical protein